MSFLRLAALVAAALSTVLPGAGAAEPRGPVAASCGSLVAARPGDTLFLIAERAYGDGWAYPAILAANADILRSPRDLEAHALVLVPCLDGAGPATRAEALIAAGTRRAAPGGPRLPEVSAPGADGFLVATVLPAGAGLAGAGLAEGGPLAEIAARALARVPGAPSVVLRAGASADSPLSLPHLAPDCARPDGLDAAARALCATAVFSAPIAEIGLTFLARADSAAVRLRAPSGLAGLRVCHDEGALGHEIARQLIAPSGATAEPAAGAGACVARLAAGETDVAVLPALAAAIAAADLGEDAFRIAEIERLARIVPLHARAERGNGDARAAIAALDEGLAILTATGEWAEIVSRHAPASLVEPGPQQVARTGGQRAGLAR